MTPDEFPVWDAPDGRTWQLIDGVPQAMAPANGTHSVMQGEIGRLIGKHLVAHRPGCRVLANPGVVPRLEKRDNFRISDLGVTCLQVPRGVVEIADPILLVEISSPVNPAQSWFNVWAYPSIPSVREILVVRTGRIGMQLLRRAPDGSWPDVPEAIDSGELELESIGFRIPVATLYAGTCLAEAA